MVGSSEQNGEQRRKRKRAEKTRKNRSPSSRDDTFFPALAMLSFPHRPLAIEKKHFFVLVHCQEKTKHKRLSFLGHGKALGRSVRSLRINSDWIGYQGVPCEGEREKKGRYQRAGVIRPRAPFLHEIPALKWHPVGMTQSKIEKDH